MLLCACYAAVKENTMAMRARRHTSQNNGVNSPFFAKEDNMAETSETVDDMIRNNMQFAKKCKDAGCEGFLEAAMHTLISLLRANILNPNQKRQVAAQLLAMKKNYDTENTRPFDLEAAFRSATPTAGPTVQ